MTANERINAFQVELSAARRRGDYYRVVIYTLLIRNIRLKLEGRA